MYKLIRKIGVFLNYFKKIIWNIVPIKRNGYICIVKESDGLHQHIQYFNAVAFHNRHYRHYHDPSGLRVIFTSLRETRLQEQTNQKTKFKTKPKPHNKAATKKRSNVLPDV